MKFNFPILQNLEDVKRVLDTGMQRLKIDENFQNFITTVTIKNGEEFGVPNKLKILPSKRIIVRQTGNGFITDGETEWTLQRLYLKNNGPSDTTVTILFLE
jgi:hypothetical protein